MAFRDLFRRGSNAAVLEPVPIPVPTRMTLEPDLSAEERELYVKAATEAGVINGPVKQEMLLAFLKESGIGSYPMEAVKAYLDDQFGEPFDNQPTWGWRPLRPEDEEKIGNRHARWNENGRILDRLGTYQGRVPMPVLETVKRIADAVRESTSSSRIGFSLAMAIPS